MGTFSVDGVALITGGGSGIGQETGLCLAESGAAGVVFADINLEGAQRVAEESKKLATNPDYRAIAVQVNVTDPASVQNMVNETIKEFGRIDYSVNSAGVAMNLRDPVMEASLEEFERIGDINTKGTMLCMRAVSKVMAEQQPRTHESRSGSRSIGRGSIINLGSVNSFIVAPKSLPYVASKFAVLGMTKAAAHDCRPHGIRVNAVCPSFVATPMVAHAIEKSKKPENFQKFVASAGRMAVPEEIAGLIVFLCSPAASYITGTGMLVDYGMSLT